MAESKMTAGGYNVHEVVSALQKAVRRGHEILALHWALELETAGGWKRLVGRLQTICYEDIGIGDKGAVIFAMQALEVADKCHSGWGSWKLPLTSAVLAMCRATKSRIADEMYAVISTRRRSGWLPNIPDAALDKHTFRGKQMGRGFAHFVDEATTLNNIAPETRVPNPYTDEAAAAWRSLDAVEAWRYKRLGYGEPLRSSVDSAPVRNGDMFEDDE